MELTEQRLREEFARLEEAARRTKTTGSDGFAMEDVAQALSVSRSYAHDMIARWIDRGLIRYSGRQARPNRVGATKSVPVYLPVEQA